MVVMLKGCCCGCTLKTGALIISMVYAILSALNVLVFSLSAVQTADTLHYMTLDSLEMDLEEPDNTTEPATDSTEMATHNATYDDDMPQELLPIDVRITMLTLWMSLSIVIVLIECGVLFINIFLMFAANKDSARLVYAWVLGFAALSVCLMLIEIVLVATIFYAGSAVAAVFILIVTLIENAGATYSTLVVYSYHRQLVGTAMARRISRQDN